MAIRANFHSISVILLCAIALQFSSCIKKPEKTNGMGIGNVLIVCEGNFGWNNAAYDILDYDNKTISLNPYYTKNNKYIGDVLQSAIVDKDAFIFCVNNSNSIVWVNKSTHTAEASMKALGSPRYICNFNDSLFLITEIYNGYVGIYNKNKKTLEKKLWIGGNWTEELLLFENKIYITNPSTGKLYIVDTEKIIVEDSINLDKGCSSIAKDKNNNLWILCSHDQKSTIFKINPRSKQIILQETFFNSMRKLIYHPGDNIFCTLVGSSVYAIFENSSIESKLFAVVDNSNLYGIAYCKKNNTIWVCDAKDYTKNGEIFEINLNKVVVSLGKTSRIPSEILFY